MVRLLYRRILHAIDNHGLRGAVLRIVHRRPAGASVEPGPERPEVEVHPFDLRYNTDTSGYVPGEALDTGSAAGLYNTAYYGISPSSLTQAIAALPIDPAQFTFVDLGCGKGRAVLVAAHEHFMRIVGVELAPDLAEVAQSNATSHTNIDIQVADASTFVYPQGALVVFLYHPFLDPLLRKVLANLVRQSAGRDIYVLGANVFSPRVFSKFPMVKRQWSNGFTLSDEDAAADRHGTKVERYTLWHISDR
jgi:SAM-dependent methyltransferase